MSPRFGHSDGWDSGTACCFVPRSIGGFEVLVTADKALRHQQNLVTIGIGVVLIMHVRNRIGDLRPLVPRVVEAIETVKKGAVVIVSG